MTSDNESNVIQLFGARVRKAAEERDDAEPTGAIDTAAASERARKQAEDRKRRNDSVKRSYRINS